MEAIRRKHEKDHEDAENELSERISMLLQLAEKERIKYNHEIAQQREDAFKKFEEALGEGSREDAAQMVEEAFREGTPC